MEVAKHGYQENVTEILGKSREMLKVFDKSGYEDNPDEAGKSGNLLGFWMQPSCQVPEQVQHGKVINNGPTRNRSLKYRKGAPRMPPPNCPF